MRPYEIQHTLSKQQQPNERFIRGEGGESGGERNAGDTGTAAPENQSNQGDYYACRLAMYTHQLALFTGALVIATAILIGTGIYQGLHLGRAANAAKVSADALPTLERAYVFIEIDIVGIIAEMKDILDPAAPTAAGVTRVPAQPPRITYQFVNHGKTPAIIKSRSAVFQHLANLPDPLLYIDGISIGELVIRAGAVFPDPPRRADSEFNRRVGVAGEPILFNLEARLQASVNDAAMNDLRTGESFLWFFGHVVYDDVFGVEHETWFCWYYNGLTNSFQRYGRAENTLNRRT